MKKIVIGLYLMVALMLCGFITCTLLYTKSMIQIQHHQAAVKMAIEKKYGKDNL